MSIKESRVSLVHPYSEDDFTQEINSAACAEAREVAIFYLHS